MNKQELIGHVADRSGLSRNDAMRAVETTLEVITSTLKRGDEVRLVGFGNFSVTRRKASTGRNPRTGAEVNIPPGKTFTHPTQRGHTVFAYVIGGKGVFCQQNDPYSYEAEGENYFDMKREQLIGDGHLVAFGDGDAVTVSAEACDAAERILCRNARELYRLEGN